MSGVIQRGRNITSIWMEITTSCNMRCPNCCCNMHHRDYVSHPWEYFEHLADIVRGTVYMLHLTGGEPTVHPQFAEFVPKLKALFGAEKLTVWTNGHRVMENEHVLHHFDEIWATKYGAENAEKIDWLVKHHPAVLFWEGGDGAVNHEDRSLRGSGRACERGISHPGAAYANGRFYPCCVGPGIPGAESMEPTHEWRTAVQSVPMPCEECWYSPVDEPRKPSPLKVLA